MKYRNTKTGAETNQFSDTDWKSGIPQKKGWVETDSEKPLKAMPKDIVDFVFKKKVKEEPKDIVDFVFKKKVKEPEIIGDVIEIPTGKIVKVKPIKHKQNDNPKQKRPAAKRKH